MEKVDFAKIIRNEFKGWKPLELTWLVLSTITVGISACFFKDSITAIIAAICGIAASVLTGKGKLSAYVVGGTGRVLYAFIALKACYYGEMLINLLYFVPMEFYGIYVWNKNMNSKTHEVKKRNMNLHQGTVLGLIIITSTVIYGTFLSHIGDRLPYLDAFANTVSIIAMIVTIKMYAQCWILWLMVNTAGIIMWIISFKAGSGSFAVLLMWCIYFANSNIMLVKWFKGLRDRA